jgi:tyrosine-protein kinase Etk/Wzc
MATQQLIKPDDDKPDDDGIQYPSVVDAYCTGFELMRERLLLAANGTFFRTIVFGGCEGGEGSTTVIRTFAEMLASTGPRVLLVDADLRTSGLQSHLVAGKADLLEVVKERRLSAPMPWGQGQLTAIPRPRTRLDSELFLRSPEFAVWLKAQRNRYDYVLVDTAPFLRFADGALIGRLADGVVIVVQACVTRRDRLLRAHEQLKRSGAHVIGTVLNREKNPIPMALRPYLQHRD